MNAPKPMLARLVRELPEGDQWIFEPKWDGFRGIAARDGADVEIHSRHGRPLGRYFPELTAALAALDAQRFVLDGELVVMCNWGFDFEALLARLHPAASRVRELAASTPAVFVAFDALALDGQDLCARGFVERRERLLDTVGRSAPPLFVTPATEDRALAARWLEEFRGGGLDGVVAKRRDQPYEPGARAMLKIKHERTADCVVAGVRVSGDPPEVTAVMLGLYDEAGALAHVGVASSFAKAARAELAREIAPLVVALEGHPWERGFLAGGGAMGRLPGAAGRWVPGMTLDWVPLAPERVAEVRYTQVDGDRLRHPAKLVRWRPDREPASCRVDQLEAEPPRADQVLSEL